MEQIRHRDPCGFDFSEKEYAAFAVRVGLQRQHKYSLLIAPSTPDKSSADTCDARPGRSFLATVNKEQDGLLGHTGDVVRCSKSKVMPSALAIASAVLIRAGIA